MLKEKSFPVLIAFTLLHLLISWLIRAQILVMELALSAQTRRYSCSG